MTRKLAALVVFLLLSQFVVSTPLSNISQPHVTISQHGLKFVVTILSICQDPIDGYLLRCQSGASTVLIWENDVRNLTIGTKYRILGTYIGVHPSGETNVYTVIVWEEIES